jgi:hypothetical protein
LRLRNEHPVEGISVEQGQPAGHDRSDRADRDRPVRRPDGGRAGRATVCFYAIELPIRRAFTARPGRRRSLSWRSLTPVTATMLTGTALIMVGSTAVPPEPVSAAQTPLTVAGEPDVENGLGPYIHQCSHIAPARDGGAG